jgi:MFS family permease
MLLAGVLALDAADKGAVGALAPSLEREFAISHFDIGLLAGLVSVVAAIATLPAGVLTDRVRRTTLLGGSVVLWGVAMAFGGFAVSFTMLLITRLFLGFVSATSGPAIASMTGDLYRPAERARILSFIQTGEFIGIGVAFLLVGAVVHTLSWRWVFWILVPVAFVLAYLLWRMPEPPRNAEFAPGTRRRDVVAREIERQHIEPNPETVLHGDPEELPLPQAIGEVMKVETNVVVIAASTVGYFFFAGLRVFAVLFAVAQYGVGESTAALLIPIVGIGALVGLLVGGRVADALVARGQINGRLIVGIASFMIASVAFVPALLTHSLIVALPALTIGAAALAAPNPPLDAVRLDVIHPKLRGRAESVRTLFRTASEAIAPIALGALADHLAGGGERGLQLTMLIILPALLANGAILALATRSYPHDVASVLASSQAITQPAD